MTNNNEFTDGDAAVFIIVLLACALFPFVTAWLWNTLIVDYFGMLRHVSYWQAAGLMLLGRLLFGFGGGNKSNG